jgi:amino acid adenylation domain-containing protein/non-ribosomal peptide synthase protein (TIGR01720 family)
VARAVDHLVAHHDALRLRFSRRPEGSWRQSWAPLPVAGSFLCLDLGGLPPAARAKALEAAAARAQASLDLAAGPLLRVVLARLGAGEPGRLLLVTHHLVSDGVSLRILLEDLGAAVARLAAGRPPEPPVRTASYRRWAEHLAAVAESEAVRSELPFWLDPRRAEVPPLPRDGEREPGRAGDQRRVVVALEADETAALLHQVPRAYRTQINDALLAALGEALAGWTGSRLALVELEGHGREAVGDDTVDVSRTVGWFTSFVPVLLDLRGAVTPGDALKTVKETLRSMPSRGVGHGLLRRLAGGEAGRLAELPEPEVSFNYLGQLDSTQPEGLPMRPARERPGPAQSPGRRRRYLLDVECRVSGGRLVASLRYSDRCHRRETIAGLAEGFLTALRELVEHCRDAGEGGATPSDFPLAVLDQAALDRLLAEHGPVADLYPLSPLQRGMLFHTLRDGESGVYVQQLTCALWGALDEDAFAAAWQRLADRQPVLRTGYVWQHLDEPVQVVAAELPVVLRRLDWRDRGDAERAADLAELLEAERRRGFDLERPPLMRLVLIRFADETWRFVWTHHHLLLDGWSLPLLVRELFALYEGERRGEPVELPRPRPYRDYIAWLAARDRGAAEVFWRRYLAGFSRPTPIDGRGPAGRGGEAPDTRDLPRMLPAAASEALTRTAQRRQLTLNTLVQGAWGLVLARSAGGSDVVYGVVSSGRPPELPGVESMLGMFIATVPARVRVRGGQTVGEWLRALQAEQVEVRRHEHAALSEIQGWSEVPRSEPLFESLLVFENYPVGEALAGERRMSIAVRDLHMEERTNYPLNLTVMPGPALRLVLSYDARRFAATTAERLVRRFETVLLALAEDPDRRLDEVPALAPAERHQVLREWNDTGTAVPPGTLHEVLARRTAERPDAVAVEHGGLALSYGELAARAGAAAGGLRRRGVGPEERVGVYLDRRPELAVALLGVLRAGGAYLPLDPALPVERLRAMVEESGVRLVVTRERLRRGAAELGAEAVLTVDGDLRQAGDQAAGAAPGPGTDGLAYLLYTSGSTGLPKAALVTHGSLVNHGTNAVRAYGLEPGDRVLQFSSIGFDMLAEDLFPTWLAGGTVVFPAATEASSPRDLSDFVERAGLTVLNLPTAHWSEWLADLEAGRRPLPGSLRMMVIGSEALPRERAEAWRRLSGGRVAWRNAYGVTEATVAAAIHRPGPAGAAPGAEAGETVPIGRAIANFGLYVLGPDLRPAPIGAAGELCIGGAGVARGYARRPALTAERFVADPYAGEPGRRLYRTGDLVRARSSGEIEFLGRIDHQVKVRGFRIEPGEIEAELSALPAVREAVVLLRREGGDPHLVAYLVPAVEEVSVGELRGALRRRLPDYMVPAAFVVLEKLPLTANGKVDRRALPAPEEAGAARDRELVPPSNETERIVAAVWREVLGTAEIGIHDDFFDLGGHSLLATRVLTRVRDAFDVELTLRDVFEHPTVARFAEHVLSRRLEREDAGELGDLVADLEGLSEEEVAALLAAEDEGGDLD